MIKSVKWAQLFLMGAAVAVAGATSAGIAVVVNPAVGDSFDKSQVERLFLGKTSKLPGGGAAQVVDQVDGTAARVGFYQGVSGKSESQVKAYWSKLIFTGKGTPPQQVADDAAVKAFVGSTANGIGYVDSGSVDGSVKVVFELP